MGETEYLVSAMPLGGYVKLFGEEETDALTPEEDRRSFAHQRMASKFLIVAAGPGFNFLLAFFIFTGWLSTGSPLFMPTFRDLTPESKRFDPGLRQRSQDCDSAIVSTRKREDISARTELHDAVAKSNGQPLTLDMRRGEQIKTLMVTPTPLTGPDVHKEPPVYSIGIEESAPIITAIMSGSAAMASGLEDGDHVLNIDGQPIHAWSEMAAIVETVPESHFSLKSNAKANHFHSSPRHRQKSRYRRPIGRSRQDRHFRTRRLMIRRTISSTLSRLGGHVGVDGIDDGRLYKMISGTSPARTSADR